MSRFECFSLVISAVAALATFTASAVALWIAHSGRRVKLKTTVDIAMSENGRGRRRIVVFQVTNVGDRPVTIIEVGWRMGFIRRRHEVIRLTGVRGDRTPETISHGASACFVVLTEGGALWIPEFVSSFSHSILSLRGQIHTSVGQTVTVVPPKKIRDELRAARSTRGSLFGEVWDKLRLYRKSG